MACIRRGFATVSEGQVHYRESGWLRSGIRPIVTLHASPGSAKTLEPLMAALAANRRVIAPDTLGNGDSSAPAPTNGDEYPPLEYFADAHLRALDSLGIETFDLYGTHTGANIAIEIALMAPHRVHRLVLDGVSLYATDEREELLRNYAPGVTIDRSGSHVWELWSFVRDAYLFWPWYRTDQAHCRRVGLPDADTLHDKAVEVLKAARTYHIPYNSALAYDKSGRLPLLQVPTLLACAEEDVLYEYFEAVRALLPSAKSFTTVSSHGPDLAKRCSAFLDFFGE